MTETTSFIVKLCFLYQSEKINLLKDFDAAKFEKVNKVKLYTSNHISKKYRLLYIPKKTYCSGLFLFLFVFFLLCFYEKGFG